MSVRIIGEPSIQKHPYNPKWVELWMILDGEPRKEWLDRLRRRFRKKVKTDARFKAWRMDVGNCLVLEAEKQKSPRKYGEIFGQIQKWFHEANQGT